MWLRGR
jgi:hypothetical protein